MIRCYLQLSGNDWPKLGPLFWFSNGPSWTNFTNQTTQIASIAAASRLPLSTDHPSAHISVSSLCLFFSVSLSNIVFVPSSASFHRLPLGSISRLIISRLTSMFSILCLFFSIVIEISSSCPRPHHFIGSLSRLFIQLFFL